MSASSLVFDNSILEGMILSHCDHNDLWMIARIRRRYLKTVVRVYALYYDVLRGEYREGAIGLRFLRRMCANRCQTCRDSQREFDAINKLVALRPKKPCVHLTRNSTVNVKIVRVLRWYLFGGAVLLQVLKSYKFGMISVDELRALIGIYKLDVSGEGDRLNGRVLGGIVGMLDNDALPRPHNWICGASGAFCRMRDRPRNVVCPCTYNPPLYSVHHLRPLQSLKKIVLCDTGIGNTGIELLRHALPDLEALDVSWCSDVTNVAEILGFRYLRNLDVGGTGITNEDIQHLHYAEFYPNLEKLGVARLDIDDSTLHRITCKKLKFLDISRCNQITDDGIELATHRFEYLRHLEAFACLRIGQRAVAALELLAQRHHRLREATVCRFEDDNNPLEVDTDDLFRLMEINRGEIDR